MANFEKQLVSLTPARNGDVDRNPPASVNRIKAILAQPGAELMTMTPTIAALPAALRRPGFATRWKGQHRLAISG